MSEPWGLQDLALDNVRRRSRTTHYKQACTPPTTSDGRAENGLGQEATSLKALPTELLLDVSRYLSPSDLVSLRYVCRQLSLIFADSMKDFSLEYALPQYTPFGPSRLQMRDAALLKHLERMKLLRLLDRDQIICPGRAVCGACCSLHNVSLFSKDELQKPCGTRQCLGREGRLWICPETILNYDQLEAYEYYSNIEPFRRCDTCDHHESIQLDTMVIIRSLFDITENVYVSRAEVANLLQHYDLRICPHVRLGSTEVLSFLFPGSRNKNRKVNLKDSLSCGCAECSRPIHTCSICNTTVGLGTKRFDGDRRRLQVSIWRQDHSFRGATDPLWIAQLAFPSEFESLREEWRVASQKFEETFHGALWYSLYGKGGLAPRSVQLPDRDVGTCGRKRCRNGWNLCKSAIFKLFLNCIPCRS